MERLLMATHNRGKLREYRQLLRGVPVELVPLDDVGITEAPEETGDTMAENARLKARYYVHRTGLATLADDSGLEVDALGGHPGVHSARYGGSEATDAERIEYLLAELRSVPEPERTARFRCVCVLAEPNGALEQREGTCEGRIAVRPSGHHGFGYDPIFFLPEFDRTMAELDADTKNRVSHRGRALAALRDLLARRFPSGTGL